MSLDVGLLRQEVASVIHLTLVKVSHLIVSALSMKLFLWESFSVTRAKYDSFYFCYFQMMLRICSRNFHWKSISQILRSKR